ncbi:unnamed protein product [Lactuca saligna]|uniref:Uncharacterized protein n=1 Tax=Lactuca saligna TaxID=75948 RepID=A0AA36A084_LACSI|nr:unnamed protein product [Lactuca saligna]
MASGNTGGASGTPTSPIRPMMALEPITAPIFTPITSETPQQNGSTITIAPMSELWRPIVEEPTSYTVVLTLNASVQTQQLTMISSSMAPPIANNVNGVPVISQVSPLNKITREQTTVSQTLPFTTSIPFNTKIP